MNMFVVVLIRIAIEAKLVLKGFALENIEHTDKTESFSVKVSGPD